MRKMFIDGRLIDDSSECYIIAEIGHNHQGKLKTCHGDVQGGQGMRGGSR